MILDDINECSDCFSFDSSQYLIFSFGNNCTTNIDVILRNSKFSLLSEMIGPILSFGSATNGFTLCR